MAAVPAIPAATATTRTTITHACGHRRRVSLHSVGAAQKSAEMFDLAARDCPTCADELAPRRAAQIEQPAEQTVTSAITAANQAAQAERQIAWLKREAQDVEMNLASLTHTAVQIGEASRWQDARLPQIDETITYWKGRYLALTQQISALSLQNLQVTTTMA